MFSPKGLSLFPKRAVRFFKKAYAFFNCNFSGYIYQQIVVDMKKIIVDTRKTVVTTNTVNVGISIARQVFLILYNYFSGGWQVFKFGQKRSISGTGSATYKTCRVQ